MIRQGQMWFAALAALASMWASAAPVDAQGIPRNIPRNELLILENPEGTIKNANWFNIWAINANSQSNGLQQAALDTLWYIDPDAGIVAAGGVGLKRTDTACRVGGARVIAH